MIYLAIPTVNNLKYLQETIASIKSKEEFQLLILDNGSNDKFTKEWIQGSGHEFILNETNLGVAKAWNQIINWGLSHEDCEIIFILNNDIVLHPDCLDTMIQAVREEDKEFITGVQIDSQPIALDSFTKSDTRFIPNVHFSCFGLTPKTIKRIGMFDEGFKIGYFEDNDYHHRMQLEGINCSCDTWAAFTHYGSRTINEGGVNQGNSFKQNRDYYQSKWGYTP
jgi:GT2 family glycosyltransferase